MTVSERPLRALTAAMLSIAGLVAAWLAGAEALPSWEVVLLFGALTVYSESKVVAVGKGVISAGWMIWIAAIVAFEGALLGSLIIGLIAAIDPPMIRARSWQMVLLNAATLGLSLCAAAFAYSLVPGSVVDAFPQALLAPVPPTVAFIAVLWPVVALTYRVKYASPWRVTMAELVPSTAQFVPFSLLGFFLGRLYLDLGPAVMVLIIVPILIAREMFASYLRVKESHDETVKMLVHALEAKDRYTSGHSERVANYAEYIGAEMNFGPARMERLRFAALMHDIGKLVVPNHLLNKPGKLTEEEFARIRIHEKVSVQMLSHIDFLRPIAAASHSDHTRFDPDDPDHPIEPYMVMIADAYDAMTSTRSYRKALPQEVAFAELREKAGIQFHPACVEALIRAIEKRGEKHGAGYEVQHEFDSAPGVGVGSAGLGDLLTAPADVKGDLVGDSRSSAA